MESTHKIFTTSNIHLKRSALVSSSMGVLPELIPKISSSGLYYYNRAFETEK